MNTEKNNQEVQPKAWADGVPVYCAHDAIVDVTTLVPNPANPNKHPDEQIQALGRIIREPSQGWRNPITVSNRSGFIVKGHGRLSAALMEGLKEVPVDYQNYESEASEYSDLVADNRIAELAEIDRKMLADIFAEIDTGELPTELTGYTEKEVEELVTALSEALHDDEQTDIDAESESLGSELDKMIELLRIYCENLPDNIACYFTEKESEKLAEYLIKNGVSVPTK